MVFLWGFKYYHFPIFNWSISIKLGSGQVSIGQERIFKAWCHLIVEGGKGISLLKPLHVCIQMTLGVSIQGNWADMFKIMLIMKWSMHATILYTLHLVFKQMFFWIWQKERQYMSVCCSVCCLLDTILLTLNRIMFNVTH